MQHSGLSALGWTNMFETWLPFKMFLILLPVARDSSQVMTASQTLGWRQMPFNQTGDNVFPFEPSSLLKAAPLPRGSDRGQAVPSSATPPRNVSVVPAALRRSWYPWKEAGGPQL